MHQIIIAIITILLLYDFKRFFIITAITITFIEQFNLASNWISIIAFVISLSKLDYKVMLKRCTYPIKWASVVIILSCLATAMVHSQLLDKGAYTYICKFVINVFIFWGIIIENPYKYLKLAYRTIVIYGAIIGIYNILEVLMQSNPYIDYVMSKDWYIYKEGTIDAIRFGLKRCQSIFGMHTTNGGVALSLGFTLLYICFYTNLASQRGRKVALFTGILLMISVFLTGARSAIIGMVVCLLSFVNFKKVKIRHVVSVIVLAIVIVPYFENYVNEIIDSLQDTSNVSGSNSDMREQQLEIAYLAMMHSPVVGNGMNATAEIRKKNPQLLGAESIWFPEMIDRGWFGIISLAGLFVSMFLYTWKVHKKYLSFFVMGFLLFGTMSSIPWFYESYVFIYLLIMIETERLYGRKTI